MGCNNGEQIQFSTSQEKVINSKNILNDIISSIAITKDCNNIFVIDYNCYLKQISKSKLEVIHDYQQIFQISVEPRLTITNDDQYLFISNWGDGNLKKVSIPNKSVVKTFENVIEGGIRTISATSDDQFLFLYGKNGYLKQMSIDTGQIVEDYGQVHNISSPIMSITSDDKFLFLANNHRNLKQISINDKKVIKEYENVMSSQIRSIAVSQDNDFLFIVDQKGSMKQLSIKEQIIEGDYKNITDTGDIRIAI